MSKTKRIWFSICCALLLAALLLVARVTLAAPEAPAIDWWVFASGDEIDSAAGADFRLSDTIGQPIVGASGGDFDLEAGFWAGVPPTYYIHLPLIFK